VLDEKGNLYVRTITQNLVKNSLPKRCHLCRHCSFRCLPNVTGCLTSDGFSDSNIEDN